MITAPLSREHFALPAQRLMRRVTAERRWTTVTIAAGAAIVIGIPVVALVSRMFVFSAPNEIHLDVTLLAPSWAHPFGTDEVGRDVLSRVLAATWTDYEVGIVATYVALAIGVCLGAIAGYFGGLLDVVIMRLVDVIIAFPFMIFVIAVVAVVGSGLTGVYIGLIAFGCAIYARLTRAEMLILRKRQYMQAAVTLGLPLRRILFVHAIPSLIRPNLVYSMASIVFNILSLAAMSYLGLGVQPPQAEWGNLIANGQPYLFSAWWISVLPGVVLVLVGIGFGLLGDGIADRLGHEYRLTA